MLKNSAEFNGFDLAVVFPTNENLVNIDNDFHAIGVMTDSRKIEKGNIFVAIKGDNFNGHNKVKDAFDNGASAAIVSKDWYNANKTDFEYNPFILDDDPVRAMGQLAKYHRNRFEDLRIITIAGSNGKTSTKEMIASVLSQKFNILKTHANFNNQIGVPIMLFQLTDEHEVAVLEIGTNMPGEVLLLSEMIKPTHGIVTNIGKEHLEQLIDIDGVEMEETSMFSELRSTGNCFINYDDERLKRYGHILETFTTYGEHEHSMIRGEIDLETGLNPKLKIKWAEEEREFDMQLKTIGRYSAKNAIAASAVGLIFELSDDEIKAGLESFMPLRSEKGYGRMYPETHRGIFFINDTYNSNPDSAKAALEILSESGNNRKIAVLGDMLEMGESSQTEHENTIELYAKSIDMLYLFGNEMTKASQKYADLKNIKAFTDKKELLKALENELQESDTALVKGSRGMKMEEVINHFANS
jgi:UDP-N-acetylmuramoyl-tripeptide--D-alanyl-D-alanine ligase